MANQNPKLENLKPFKKGQVANPYGRPKKLVSQILSDLKKAGYKPVTKEQISATYQTLLILPEDKLKEMIADKDQPMLNRIIAKAIIGGKGFENIEKMLDRAQGKPMQKTEHSGEINSSIVIKKGQKLPDDYFKPNNNRTS